MRISGSWRAALVICLSLESVSPSSAAKGSASWGILPRAIVCSWTWFGTKSSKRLFCVGCCCCFIWGFFRCFLRLSKNTQRAFSVIGSYPNHRYFCIRSLQSQHSSWIHWGQIALESSNNKLPSLCKKDIYSLLKIFTNGSCWIPLAD